MVPDVDIRRATEADVAGIQRVARTAWHEAYGEFLDDGVIDDLLEQGYSTAFLEDAIAATDMTLFVAEDEYSVVGYVSCELPAEGDVGQVSIYVSPDYWGEGIGGDLLERATEYLDAKGAEAMQDTVLAENEVGNAFYEKYFEPTDETTVEMGPEELPATVYTGEL